MLEVDCSTNSERGIHMTLDAIVIWFRTLGSAFARIGRALTGRRSREDAIRGIRTEMAKWGHDLSHMDDDQIENGVRQLARIVASSGVSAKDFSDGARRIFSEIERGIHMTLGIPHLPAAKGHISDLLIFRDGSISALDSDGNQIPELQRKSLLEWFAEAATAGGYTTDGCKFKGPFGNGCLVGKMQQFDREVEADTPEFLTLPSSPPSPE